MSKTYLALFSFWYLSAAHACPELMDISNDKDSEVILEDCTHETLFNKKKVCDCVERNIIRFPGSTGIDDEAKKALARAAIDKTKIAYLNLLENFSTLQNYYKNENLPSLKDKAPQCVLKDFLAPNKDKPNHTCSNQNPVLGEEERLKLTSDFFKGMYEEAMILRKSKDPAITKGHKGIIDRQISSENSCGVKDLTDEFVADVRDESVKSAMDLFTSALVNKDNKLDVDLDLVFADMKDIYPELKSKADISLEHVIEFKNYNDQINGGSEDKYLIGVLKNKTIKSPILKDLMKDPKHLTEMLKRIQTQIASGTTKFTALGDYVDEVKLNKLEQGKMLDKMNKQCEKVNQQFKKTLCLSKDASFLPPSTPKQSLKKAKNILRGSQDLYNPELKTIDAGKLFNSSLILNQTLCSEAPEPKTNIFDESNAILDPDLSIDLANKQQFDEASIENHYDEYIKPANKICGIFPESTSTPKLLLTNGVPSTPDRENYIKEACKGDSEDSIKQSCRVMLENSLNKLYGENGKSGVRSFLINDIQTKALETAQNEGLKDPARIDARVKEISDEKIKNISTKDLMSAYSAYKDQLLASKNSNLVTQMFNEKNIIKETTSPTSKSQDAKLSSASTGPNSSSGNQSFNTKTQRPSGKKFNSANLDNAKNEITKALANTPKAKSIYSDIIDRARVSGGNSVRTPDGSSLSNSTTDQAINDAISSFTTPGRTPAQSDNDIDANYEEQGAQVAQAILSDSNPTSGRSVFSGGENLSKSPQQAKEDNEADLNAALGETEAALKGMENYEKRKLKGPGLIPPASVTGKNSDPGGSATAGEISLRVGPGEVDSHFNTLAARALAEAFDPDMPEAEKQNLKAIKDFVLNDKPIIVINHVKPNEKVAIKKVRKGSRDLAVVAGGKDVNEKPQSFQEFKTSIENSNFVKMKFSIFYDYLKRSEDIDYAQSVDLTSPSYQNFIQTIKDSTPKN